jgi:hypothetical protein
VTALVCANIDACESSCGSTCGPYIRQYEECIWEDCFFGCAPRPAPSTPAPSPPTLGAACFVRRRGGSSSVHLFALSAVMAAVAGSYVLTASSIGGCCRLNALLLGTLITALFLTRGQFERSHGDVERVP